MKKIVSVLIILVLCFMLCSCDAIDSLYAVTAYSDGQNLTVNGTKYCPTNIPAQTIQLINPEYIYVADKGVPILLVPSFSKNAKISLNGDVISLGYVYVKEGKEEEFKALAESEFTHFAASYYSVEKNAYGTWVLNDELCDIFKLCLNQSFKESFDNTNSYNKYLYITEVERCDADGIFSKETFQMYYNNDAKSYFITTNEKAGPIMKMDIPEQYTEMFDNFFKATDKEIY